MSILVYKDTTIYIASPAQFASGGPEALHQLHFKLKELGYTSTMHYLYSQGGDPVPERYKRYDVTHSALVEDTAHNILIVPEVCTDTLEQYKNIQKVVWWLSIDNYYESLSKRHRRINTFLKNVLHKTCRNYSGFDKKRFYRPNYFHLAQSKYAFDFLKMKGLKQVYMLSDYLSTDYLKDDRTLEKHNRVVYNPAKGFRNTHVLIQARPDIDWVPLKGMTLDQVKDTLRGSKVYIDFGHHPGKDRLPREAAVNGCCIITGKDGAAANEIDVEIPPSYKFENVQKQKKQILDLIEKCFGDYNMCYKNFLAYVDKIKTEEVSFEKEIDVIFKRYNDFFP